ncbi:MAG: hypothetical protein N2109_09785 [Fimbriimonadales bacterium]|nr:hypothetical protein [Fimbriimonadales bacterium]
MAAQDREQPRYCEKCFSLVPSDKEYCPECGAPMPTGGYTEGSDAEIYPELARSNLLRMRGEYEQAKQVCLALLRRFPNNATANALLGDISAEMGEEEQAIQWYELALEISPDSQAIRSKLDSLRTRMSEREAAAGARLLGIGRKGALTLYGLGLVALVVVVGVSSYLVGSRRALQGPATGVVEQPLVVDQPEAEIALPEPRPAAPAAKPQLAEDQRAFERLSQSPELANRLVAALVEPRDRRAILTLEAAPGEDPKTVAAQAAVEAVSLLERGTALTLRVRQGTQLVLVADVDEDVAERFHDAGQPPHGWPDQVLTNVWPAHASGAAAPSPAEPLGGGQPPADPRPSEPPGGEPTPEGGGT